MNPDEVRPGQQPGAAGLALRRAERGLQRPVARRCEARPRDVFFGGGVTSGATTTDRCFVVNSPQDRYQCRNEESWHARTQFKAHVVAPLPGKVRGQRGAAGAAVDSAAGGLCRGQCAGRGDAGTAAVRRRDGEPHDSTAAERTTHFAEGWNHQVDFRVSRTFTFGPIGALPAADRRVQPVERQRRPRYGEHVTASAGRKSRRCSARASSSSARSSTSDVSG